MTNKRNNASDTSLSPEADFWQRRPDPDDTGIKYEIVRVGPKGLSGVVILSYDVVGTNLHYYAGRSTPCVDDACPACANGQ